MLSRTIPLILERISSRQNRKPTGLFMNRNYRQIPLLAAVTLLILGVFFSFTASAQTNIEVYGQNRVQYRNFSWRFFDTEHFRIYHYDAAGRTLARYVAEQAEKDISIVERKLGGQFPRRFNIVLYNNYDEYRQTNVGRKYEGQLADVPAGTVNLVGDRLVVYFTGVHTDLHRQLRIGMSHVVMERMLFGESFREMVKSAVLLNLPAWASEGFITYLVDGWDATSESQWKTLLAARPRANFYTLGEEYPEIAGKAFWKFVAETLGEKEVKDMLYAMQTKSSLTKGIRMVMGMKVKKAYDSCISFYKGVYAKDALRFEKPDSSTALIAINVPKDNRIIRNIKVSPRGADIAYVSWQDGEYEVYLQHALGEQARSRILSGGRKDYNEKTPDPNYPLMAWSNNGYKLAILYRKGTQTRLRIYNSLRAKIENYVIPPNRFDRVLGITFMEDDDRLVFSAIKRSQTDLYEFRIRGSRLTNITNDPWDDTQPWFVSGGSRRGLAFLSNRPKPNLVVPAGVNELPTGPNNVFFYDTKTQRPELLQCSRITRGIITQPIQYGPDNFAFLYDTSGVRNQYVVTFGRTVDNKDSAYAVPVTNYSQSIIEHQYNPASNKVSTVVQDGEKYKVYIRELQIPGKNIEPKVPPHTALSQTGSQLRKAIGDAIQQQKDRNEPVKLPVVQGQNIYQSEFDNDTTSAPVLVSSPLPQARRPLIDTAAYINPTVTDSTYLQLRSQPYRLSFKPDFFTVKVDNTVLFTRYQSFENNGGQYSNPSLGGMLTVSLDDALEDHRFTGGVRLPVNFSGMTYYLQYQNFKRRWDWGLLFLRTEGMYNFPVSYADSSGSVLLQRYELAKVITNMVQGSASYAFDRVRRIDLQMALRQDVRNWKAQDTLSLSFLPQQKTYWALSRAEYVFDNSITPELNIRRGFRYKVFAEYMYGFNNNNGGVYNLGLDFRYYHRIYKNITLATRVAGAGSGGNQRIMYYLGGVDNWISPKYANGNPTDARATYAFQALATNLRGYEQNARNGSSYGVVNAELRVPIITTLFQKPIKSGLLRHLQVVGFADAGTAWNGLLPTPENTSKSVTLTQYPVSVTLLQPSASDLAIGYGGGLRTMLFGYFIRADAAWNVDGRRKPLLHLSIGTDF